MQLLFGQSVHDQLLLYGIYYTRTEDSPRSRPRCRFAKVPLYKIQPERE